MKKIFLSFIALFTMFFCVMSAEAWQPNYTAYEAGNEIEVVLGKGLKAKFYVIEDSDSKNGSVTAIYKDVLGEPFYFGPTKASIAGSTAKTKLDELTKDWKTPNEIRLIDVSEINDEIDTSSEEEYEFTKPVYLNIGKSYWTQTVINNGETYRPYLVTTWNTFSTLHTTQSNSPSNGGYIRPVIEIEKEYVQGGLVKPKNWDELVDFYSNVIIEAEFELKTVKTENSLYAKLTDNEWADEANFDLVDNLLTYKAVYKEGDTPILSEFMFECVIYWDAFRIVYDGYFIDGTFQLTINEPYLTVIRDDNNRITEMTADLETLYGWNTKEDKENKALWNKFVEEFKKTDIYKLLADVETNTIDVTSTEKTLKIVANDGKKSVTTNFTYDNGIVSFVPSDNVETALVDGIWISNAIATLSNIKGYDPEKVNEWIKEDRKFTLKDDGIEMTTEKFKSGSISGDRCTSFKLDIKNGLKSFANKKEEIKEEVKNPKTADTNVILVTLGLIASGSLIVISKKKLCKNK